MSKIAGLQDLRQEGPPADIGTFQVPCDIIAFSHVFSGVTYYCALRAGDRGWVLIDHGTVALTVLQSAVNSIPVTGCGVIFIKPPFYADGELVIDRPGVTILSEMYPDSNSAIFVTIDNILIDSSNRAVTGVRIQGIFTYMIRFYAANGNYIEHTYFDECYVHSNGGLISEGIVFDGDDAAGSDIHNIYFTKCYFYDGGQSARAGFVSFICIGAGQIYFDHCHYACRAFAATYTFMACEDEGLVSPDVSISHCDFIASSTCTAWNFFILKSQTNAAKIGRVYSLKVNDCWFEHNCDGTLYTIEDSVQPTVLNVLHNHNTHEDASGKTVVIISNANTAWDSPPSYSSFNFLGNNRIAWGTMNIGTPGALNPFSVRIMDNFGINPINRIVNCFDSGRNFIETDGAAAVPVASKNYKVECAGILITAANSANNNNAIIIKDGAGNAITAAAGTLNGVYVPHGFIINWGAFTGAAGACTVCFV